ncbi:MAG TPA: GntR family transcriptional regulator [Anaerovoracaceae bacterium]|nr:GntR family transcriptional regulator [Anaerovoracaceae bacterium]
MFQLDMKSRKSIYEQVIDNLKELIMTGVLAEGERLPSVRDLSKQITVNPNTVLKAYKELERAGYVYTTSGVGTFVAAKEDILMDDKKIDDIKREILSAFKDLQYLGLTYDEAVAIVKEVILERSNQHD